jgi:hypothetical protein
MSHWILLLLGLLVVRVMSLPIRMESLRIRYALRSSTQAHFVNRILTFWGAHALQLST